MSGIRKTLKDILRTEHEELQVEREELSELREIEHDLHPKHLTRSIAVKFTGDNTMSLNSLSLAVGQTSTASILAFLADGVTSSGGTVSNAAYTFSDPSATVVLNADGLTALVNGVAASTAGAVTGTATCTVTDTDSAVSQWSQAFTITVTPAVVPPAQLTQSIAVSFTTPA
jgi:hypothetical protein